MKRKYKLHPGLYEIGENEKFYSDMEAKGWRLGKRGAYFSWFLPVEPSNARYRIEVLSPGFLDQPVMPEEQLAVFADCGWEYVTDWGVLHIFRAPAGSDAPEFYADPAQQAETLKRMKRDAVWGWIPQLAVWAIYFLLFFTLNGASRFGGEFQKGLIEMPPLFLLVIFLLLQGLYNGVRSAWIITRTYRRLKKGVPLDHSPSRSRRVHRAANGFLWALVVLSGLLLAAQIIDARSTDLPEATEDPYLLLSDLGWEGERTTFMNRDSGVTHSRTLLADYWDTVEYMECPNGADPQMYQDVYRLRNPDMAYWLADALMNTSTFGSGGENFAPLQAEGLDTAWANPRMEIVAVKGDLVTYIIYLAGSSRDFDPQAICQVLAEKWAD